jgi:hypothetical protein
MTRMERLARALALTLARARAAKAAGDQDGYRYLMHDARRLARALEG